MSFNSKEIADATIQHLKDIGARALVLPAALEKGRESTLAADRSMLVDPRGQIDENDLLEFLEKYIEPKFWDWLKTKSVSHGSDSKPR